MSTPINDGGPAFPVPVVEYQGSHYPMSGDPSYLKHGGGMTLRDWFAGQALSGILMNYTTEKFGVSELDVGFCAYKYADAMLAARERKESAT